MLIISRILRIFIINLFFVSLLNASNEVSRNEIYGNEYDSYIKNYYFQSELANFNNFMLSNPPINTDYNHLYHEHDKWDYIKVSSSLVLGFMFTTVIALYFAPTSFTGWEKTTWKEDLSNIQESWVENVKAGPVMDKDDFFLNYIAHPYVGALYYMQTRNAGFTPFQSFLYSAVLSTFLWEYGIEAFAEVPSKQDLIITPVLGSLVGELFFIGSNKIKKNDGVVWGSKTFGYTLLGIMDPVYLIIETTRLHKYVEKKEDGNYNVASNLFLRDSTAGMVFTVYLK